MTDKTHKNLYCSPTVVVDCHNTVEKKSLLFPSKDPCSRRNLLLKDKRFYKINLLLKDQKVGKRFGRKRVAAKGTGESHTCFRDIQARGEQLIWGFCKQVLYQEKIAVSSLSDDCFTHTQQTLPPKTNTLKGESQKDLSEPCLMEREESIILIQNATGKDFITRSLQWKS